MATVEGAVLPLPSLPSCGMDMKEYLNNIEYGLITQALTRTGGVVAHAAKLLKLRRTTLVEKLHKYGMRRDAGQDVEDRIRWCADLDRPVVCHRASGAEVSSLPWPRGR